MIRLGTTKNGIFEIDLDKLITSRLLIQASSGAGKSYLLRRLAEVCGNKMQIIVFDPEGEFSTLRKLLDMVLVSDVGEIKPDPKNAGMLARRIMEHKVSAVCDLYALKLPDRHLFVKRFLDSLMALPRNLWRPTLVFIDESQKFCPERGKGESCATGSVIDLLSQGRKRGFCAVLATQRLSKLNKDAAAECGTIFIGRTSPVDQKRAADVLGIQHTNPSIFTRLSDGEFLGFGPSLNSGEVKRFKVDPVVTEHPQAGKSHKHATPAPSKGIKKVAKELMDLARSDDAPLTIDEATITIKKLKKEINTIQRSAPKADPQFIQRKIDEALKHDRIVADKDFKSAERAVGSQINALNKKLSTINKISMNGSTVEAINVHERIPQRLKNKLSVPVYRQPQPTPQSEEATKLAGGMLRMAQTLADRHPAKFTIREWGTLSRMSHKSGTFGQYKSRLASAGLFETDGTLFWASDKAIDLYGDPNRAPQSPEELLLDWKGKVGAGGISRMLDALVTVYPEGLTKPELGVEADMSSRSGTFGQYLSRLRSNNLIMEKNNMIYVADMLVEAV